MKKNEYQCAVCQGIFEKGVSDEKAMKESIDIWGKIPEEEMMVICDDCWKRKSSEEIKKMGEEYKSK